MCTVGKSCSVLSEMQAKNLKSHTQWITALHWHPSNANQLLSASHDKTLKVWDLRASLPLYTLQGHTEGVRLSCSLKMHSMACLHVSWSESLAVHVLSIKLGTMPLSGLIPLAMSGQHVRQRYMQT